MTNDTAPHNASSQGGETGRGSSEPRPFLAWSAYSNELIEVEKFDNVVTWYHGEVWE